MRLQKPSLDFVRSYLEFIEEIKVLGEKVWEGNEPSRGESHEQFVEKLIAAESTPLPERVPENVYWAVDANEVVGRIALRHFLNENLKEFGGHIGYEVRPSSRRKGFAKEMLRLLLQTPRAKEIGELLLTCSPDNIASHKTITANGGALTGTAYVEKWQRNTNYYWIDLRPLVSVHKLHGFR